MRDARRLMAATVLVGTLAGCITPPAYVPPEDAGRYKQAHLACMSMMYAGRDVHGTPSWNVYGYCMKLKGYPPPRAEAGPAS